MATRGRPQDLRGVIDERFREVWEHIRELERPDWTQINNLPSKMLEPDARTAAGSGFTMSTAMTTRASVSIPIPAGFTRALVFGAGFVYSGSASSGGDRIYGSVRIAGSSGPESIATLPLSWPVAGVAAFQTVSLTGLSGGSILAETQTRLQFGPGDSTWNGISTATVAAQALFLR